MNLKTIGFCILAAIYVFLAVDNIKSVNTDCRRDVRVATVGDYNVTVDDTFATELTSPSRMIIIKSILNPEQEIVGYDRRASGRWDEIQIITGGHTNLISSSEHDRAHHLLNEMLDARMSPTIKWQRVGTPH